MATDNNLPNHPEHVTAQLAGVIGGSLDASAAATDGADKQPRHVISAANSVTSSNSLSSTKSAAPPPASAGGGAPSLFLSGGAPQPAPATSAPAAATSTSAPVPGVDPASITLNAPPHPVAEFLFQLTKMLTDNNSKYIEWRNASIFVHDPPGLEKDILPKYFRHSNYSSFQRQMNYFGFRKIAGKGKMAPCSYVNEAAKEDISSLLFIKRKKTGVSSAAAKLMAQQNRINRSLGVAGLGLHGGSLGVGGIGLGAANPLLGLPNSQVQANPALTINNIMVGAPGNNLMSHMPSAPGTFLSAGAGSNINQSKDALPNPQNMLAQLQQAHAAALMSNQLPPAGGGGGIPQAAPSKVPNASDAGSGANTNNNAGTLPNDQGQGAVYASPAVNPATTEWSTQADAAAQSLFLAQCQLPTQGLAGGFPQAAGYPQAVAGGNVATDPNGMVRIDSAANLRALINQQISMFQPPGAAPAPLGGAPLGAPGPAAPQAAPVPMALPPTTAAAPAGGVVDWNEVLRGMGGGAGAAAALEQLGFPGAPVGGPAAAPVGQTFDFAGLFGAGGTAGG